MVRGKLPMELLADKKSRFRVFRNREKGLKKKLYELSTLCDIKACMIINGPDGDGPKEGRQGKGTLGLSDVLEIWKKSAGLEPPKLQEEMPKLRGVLWRVEWMSFPHEELMEIIGKLDKKLEEVENIIDFKKGETNKMIECTVHDSHMKGLSAIQGLDIYVPMEYSRRTLEGGVDEFSLEELMNIIDLKKGETNSMNEHTVHGSHMKGLSAIEGLDSYVPTLDDGVDEFSYEELMEND
ncbi:hypothetical protein CK203_063779 [Vitis vinifera]|uniref:MADS-box domain-containing protein n=1 Tax=Vitis vinifera TaxID=29760 RepID=A0A438GZS6_VITVI|nr:hypothetical protein CK203_063779 [Vitis vinifera]